MSLASSLRSVVSALFLRSHHENEMDEELRAHVQNRADDLERCGLTPAEAERRARIEFGGHEKLKEEFREERGGFWLDTVGTEFRCCERILRKTPAFTPL